MQEKDVDGIANLYAPVAALYPDAFALIATRKAGKEAIINKVAVQMKNLKDYLTAFKPTQNCDYYITPNVYKGGFRKETLIRWRREENLLSLCNIVIDVDSHEEEGEETVARIRRQRLRNCAKNVHAHFEQFGLDFSIIFTGRGLQFWLSFRPLALACRWLVDKLIDDIIGELESFLFFNNNEYGDYDGLEVDEAASRRLSGVFRFPHTRNTKAKTMGGFLHVAKQDGKDIRELLSAFEAVPLPPAKREKKRNDKVSREKASIEERTEKKKEVHGKKRGTRLPRHIPLLMARKSFIEWLAHRVKAGRRNNCVFAYYNTVKGLTKSLEDASEAAFYLNTLFPSPLPAKEVEKLVYKLEHVNKMYSYSYATFFSAINATREELEAWRVQYVQPYLIRRAKRIAENKANRKKVRAQKREAQVKEIRRLLRAGWYYREVSKELHVSLSSVCAVVKAGGDELKKEIEKGKRRRMGLEPSIEVLSSASSDEVKFLAIPIAHVKNEEKRKAKIEAERKQEEKDSLPLFDDVAPRPSLPISMPLPLSLALALPYVLRMKVCDFTPSQISFLAQSLKEQRETVQREEEAKRAFKRNTTVLNFEVKKDAQPMDFKALHEAKSKPPAMANDGKDEEEKRIRAEVRSSFASATYTHRPLFNPNWHDESEEEENREISLSEMECKKLDDLLRRCRVNPDLIPFADSAFTKRGFASRVDYAKWRYNMIEERKKRNAELYQQRITAQKQEQAAHPVPAKEESSLEALFKYMDEETIPF